MDPNLTVQLNEFKYGIEVKAHYASPFLAKTRHLLKKRKKMKLYFYLLEVEVNLILHVGLFFTFILSFLQEIFKTQ